jgi:hypothetical protein
MERLSGCVGDIEGSPKGRKRCGPCLNGFEIGIEITYKDASF